MTCKTGQMSVSVSTVICSHLSPDDS